MQDWSVKRLEINRKVRTVLVRHGIDLGLITVRVYPRRIILRGSLNRLAGSGKPLDATTVETIIGELERVEGVNQVYHDLGNWSLCGSTRKWQKTQTPDDAFSGANGLVLSPTDPGPSALPPTRA